MVSDGFKNESPEIPSSFGLDGGRNFIRG